MKLPKTDDNASFWTSASYEQFKSLILKSRGLCASLNTVQNEKTNCHNPFLIGFFHKLISMQDVGHMVHLNKCNLTAAMTSSCTNELSPTNKKDAV